MNNAIENLNIARDVRSHDAVKAPVLYMDDGEEVELPMTWAVCHVCNGKGRHVNPAIDAGGLSAEMQDDVDFLDDYMAGTYDQVCNGCKGRTTVPAVDWDALTTEQRELYTAQLQADADCEAERLAEIRMGC
jgi:hypothetical protein